jgi:hypothetical protein
MTVNNRTRGGTYEQATAILSRGDAIVAAADANKRMIELWESEWILPSDEGDARQAQELIELTALSQMARSLAEYATAMGGWSK